MDATQIALLFQAKAIIGEAESFLDESIQFWSKKFMSDTIEREGDFAKQAAVIAKMLDEASATMIRARDSVEETRDA